MAQKSISDFLLDMKCSGYSIFPEMVRPDLLAQMRIDAETQIEACRQIQLENGLVNGMHGAAHHVIGAGDSYDAFLYEYYLDEYIQAFFGGPYILNTYGLLDNRSDVQIYEHGLRFHRDVRTFTSDFPLTLNMLVMIDDFTLENGATKVLPGSHHFKDRPSDDYLEKNCVRATGKAGTILMFDSNLWHSAAPNSTGKSRRALTPMFSRPFFKQQLDYPRLLGEDFPKTEKMRQLLGYNSRVPANRHEWYQPPEKRMYKPGQG